MATISDYMSSSYYDNTNNYSNAKSNSNLFLSGLSVSSDNSSFSLSDYATIKNGSYGKLLKAYYAQQKADQTASGDTTQKLTLMQSSANSLSQSVQNLMKDSLWEKKTKTEKDETTGEEKEVTDYDWDAIVKAVNSFVESYNDTVENAAESNTKNVLRNAAWMVSTTNANSNLLAKIGISIGSGNKLEVDEDTLRNADISTLKTLFTGYNSYVSQINQKANSISNAAASAGGIYTSNGTYSSTLSSLVSSKVDAKS
ncbi:MAG: hypothetical protein ACI4ES_09565 [Roseburia sp.]